MDQAQEFIDQSRRLKPAPAPENPVKTGWPGPCWRSRQCVLTHFLYQPVNSFT